MALTLTELQATTREYFDSKEATDNFFNGNLFTMRLMPKAKKVPGGKWIHVPIEYADSGGGSFEAGDTFDLSKVAILNAAQFNWAYHYVPVVYDMDDEVQNSGELEQEVDIVKTKLKNAQETIRQNIGDQLYTGTGANKQINGLVNLFNTTTTTAYGNIQEGDIATWKANSSATAAVMTRGLLQALRREAKINDSPKGIPNLYVTTDTLRDAYEGRLQPQQIFSDSKLADAGFENIKFGGAVVVADMKCPDNYLHGFNENFLGFRVHTKFNFKRTDWMRQTNQMLYSMQIIWAGQFVTNQRRAHTRRTAISA